MRIQDIDNALNNAFSQRQISTIYSAAQPVSRHSRGRPLFQRDPADLTHVYVAGNGSTQVPLSSVAQYRARPRAARHQPPGPVPGGDHHLQSGAERPDRDATAAIEQAVAELHLPDTLHAEFAGDAKAFSARSARSRW